MLLMSCGEIPSLIGRISGTGDFTTTATGSVKSITLLPLLNQGRCVKACRQLSRWIKVKVKGEAILRQTESIQIV